MAAQEPPPRPCPYPLPLPLPPPDAEMDAIDDEAGGITAHVQLRLLPSHPKLRNEPSLKVDVHSAQFAALRATVERFVRSAPLQSRAFADSALSILRQIELPATMHPCVFRVEGAHLVVDHHTHRASSPNAAAAPLRVRLHAYHLRSGMERMHGATVTQLPTAQLEAAWHCLHLRDGVKSRLLSYMLVRRKLNNSAACSGLLLLHGPPGSGKTTAARALAQQGAIRNGGRGVLVHVHPELLLSKFFAESAQNVGALFERIASMATRRRNVFVLLDEVESVGLARCSSMNGAEPGDAIRVVNALLQGVDKLAPFGNVMMMATSNLAFGLEQALLDRADVSILLAAPQGNARVAVVLSAIEELVRCGIVRRADGASRARAHDALACALGSRRGMSGRRLRKMAVAALVEVFQGGGMSGEEEASISFERAVDGVIRAVERAAHEEEEEEEEEEEG